MSNDDSEKSAEKQPWPELPKPLQNRMSVKWTTMESLRVLQNRLYAQGDTRSVLLLTACGAIQGKLSDISDNYEVSLATDGSSDTDLISATVHLRNDLWHMYAKKDPELQAIDSGALIHLTDVTYRVGNRRLHAAHMGVFASEVIGFTLLPDAGVLIR